MADINIPKFKFKPPTQEMLFREIAEKEYKPVVEIISDGFRSQIEGDVFRIIHSYGINVDKGELIKALQYDRQQYEKGFIDGCRGAVADIKAEVAREIFAEINAIKQEYASGDIDGNELYVRLYMLEKKYTEEKT